MMMCTSFSTADTTDVLALGPARITSFRCLPNGEVVIFLTWDDPFGGSTNNYDLDLVRQSTNAVVASSTDVQSGAQDPVEAIDYVNTGGSCRRGHALSGCRAVGTTIAVGGTSARGIGAEMRTQGERHARLPERASQPALARAMIPRSMRKPSR
jgi:hypothetical protein